MRHICLGILTTIASDNGLSPGRCQAIIWTNGGTLLSGPSEIIFSKISIENHAFHIQECHLQNGVYFVSPSMSWGIYNYLSMPDVFICFTKDLMFHIKLEQSCCWWTWYKLGYISMMAVDVLVPNWLQTICSHHANPNPSGQTGTLWVDSSIPWLLMSRLLASSGHQQPQYWLCRMCISFKDLRHLNVAKQWEKNQLIEGQVGHVQWS